MKKMSLKNKIWVVVLILIPMVLFILPKTQFDHGPTTCLITLVTGKNCFGCGMTRACMRLIHFDILGALSFNKLSLLIFPFLVYQYLRFLYKKLNNQD